MKKLTGHEINFKERIALVKAMDFVCQNLNDENDLMLWWSVGVADGDLPYQEIVEQVTNEELENLAYYAEDDNFDELIKHFLRRMIGAIRSGGLYCNGIYGTLEN